jgi:hypothetical protein
MIKSLNMGGIVTDEHGNMTQFSLVFPSESCPDLESLLSHVISFVNEEAGTEFRFMLINKEKVMNKIMDTVTEIRNIDLDPNRKSRIKKNIKELGYDDVPDWET